MLDFCYRSLTVDIAITCYLTDGQTSGTSNQMREAW